jgi:muramidase (phage lysozyme)
MNQRGKENLAYTQNPNVAKFLAMIQAAEGSKGYASGFNNVPLKSLDAHPMTKSTFKQTDGTTNSTTAAGKYQFLGKTWTGLKNKLGLEDFSGPAQEAAAVELLREKGALDAIIKGDWTTALAKTGSTWASLPTSPYKQAKRSLDFVYNALGEKRPEGAVFKEFFKQPTPASSDMPIDTTTPYNAATAAPANWAEDLVRQAQIDDDTRNKQQSLHNMFADKGAPEPNNEFELPPALRAALDDIIKAV